MLIFLLAAATAGADLTAIPQPLGDPAAWVTGADLPAEARRTAMQGKVQAEIGVDDHGVVRSCGIRETSGHELLDATTCQLILKRAKFLPAKNAKGEPVDGKYYRRFRWSAD